MVYHQHGQIPQAGKLQAGAIEARAIQQHDAILWTDGAGIGGKVGGQGPYLRPIEGTGGYGDGICAQIQQESLQNDLGTHTVAVRIAMSQNEVPSAAVKKAKDPGFVHRIVRIEIVHIAEDYHGRRQQSHPAEEGTAIRIVRAESSEVYLRLLDVE